MKLKNIILLLAMAGLSACSFDKNDSLTDPNELAQREKAKAAYESVSGTYQGTVGSQTVELRLYMLEINDGTNSSGAIRKKPVLYGNYKRKNPVDTSFEFDATYYQERRELVLTNQSTDLMKDDVHTIVLQVVGDRLVGRATYQGGYQNSADLTLVSRESSGDGGSSEDNEYYDALRKQYEAIAGTYQGDLVNPDGTVYMTARVALQVYNQVPDRGTISIPYLRGSFHDIADVAGTDPITKEPFGFSDLTLAVTYNLKVTPHRLTLVGTPVFGSSKFTAGLELQVINGNLVGTYTQSPILRSTTVDLKRVK